MNRAFELNKAEKYDEALEAFLLVGKNTEKQRAEEERQVYVCSQIMVAMCCELTGMKKGICLPRSYFKENSQMKRKRTRHTNMF